MPGLIDNHTHLSMPFGGTWSCDDYDTGTAAAAAGGTTCIVDFIIQYVGGSLKDAREEWHGRADGAAHIDYGFHMAITDARPERRSPRWATASSEGITSFKVFMAYKGALMVDDEQFLAVLEQTGKTGGLVMVHCENGDAVVRYQKEAMAARQHRPEVPRLVAPARGRGRGDGPRDPARGVDRSGRCSSCTSPARRRCEEIRAARDRGLPIFGETCIQYLYLTVDDLDRPGFEGAKYVCSPPLREEQQPGGALPGAAPGRAAGHLDRPLPVQLQRAEGARARGLHEDPERAAGDRAPADAALRPLACARGTCRSWTSCATARGARRGSSGWTRKGAIAPGFDADVVVFDPEVKHTISAKTHVMNVDYDPFEGWEVTGKPRFVLSRGETVYDGRQGRLLARATGGSSSARSSSRRWPDGPVTSASPSCRTRPTSGWSS